MKIFISFILIFIGAVSFSQESKIAPLEEALEKAESDSAKVRIYCELALASRRFDLEQAKEYTNNALNLAIAINERISLTRAISSFASYTNFTGEYDKSIEYAQKAIQILKADTNNLANNSSLENKLLGNLYTAIGMSYDFKSEHPEAINYHKKAIEAFVKCEHKEGVAVGHNNIGVSYIYMGEFDEAEENFSKCFDIYISMEDTIGAYSAKMNLGAIEYYRGDPLAAVEVYKEVGQVMEKSGNLQSQSNCYANAGLTYTELGQLDSAEHYLFKALATDTLVGDPESVSATYRTIANFYTAQNAFGKARKYFRISLEMAEEIRQLNTISLIYEQMSEMESAAGNNVLALDYYKTHTAYHDTLQSQNNDTELGKKEAEFEYNKQLAVKEAEGAQRLKVEEEKRRKQALILYFSLGILGVIMFFVYMLIKSLKQTREQKALVEEAREEIELKNQEMVDSITYAKRIQTAILPPDSEVKKLLPDAFILYKPKDIVAGDFYWMEQKNNQVLFAAADCTGHGVPGAMVSVVCNNGLNRAVREFDLSDPGHILDKTREIVIQEFEKSEEKVKDGMDIALCSLSGYTLRYAGAHNPLWVIRKGGEVIEEYKANKQPIGQFDHPQPYISQQLQLNPGDQFYIFSDGYADQFGGEKGKKFKAANFKQLLLDIANRPMSDQKVVLDEAFESWKGGLEQLDDVCVIGVRV